MQRHLALAALALILAASPGAGAEPHGRWSFAGQPHRIAPFPYVVTPSAREARLATPAIAAGGGPGPARQGRPAAWRYDPDPSCVAPQCLPSYWRPVYPPEPRPGLLLPLAAVVERLKRLDYTAYGATLDGANYWIDAIDRHGRAMRLVVDAGTGMIRRTLP